MKVDKVTELIELALKANSKDGSTEARERNITGNKPMIVSEFQGHINTLIIKIFASGWSIENTEHKEFWIPLNDNSVLTEQGLGAYEECKAYLLKLLEASDES